MSAPSLQYRYYLPWYYGRIRLLSGLRLYSPLHWPILPTAIIPCRATQASRVCGIQQCQVCHALGLRRVFTVSHSNCSLLMTIGGTQPSHAIDSITELYHFTLSHYGLPALCPTLKRHCLPLTLQGLDTGGSLHLTGSDSHRLYIPHRTGAHPFQNIPCERLACYPSQNRTCGFPAYGSSNQRRFPVPDIFR